MKQYRGLQLDEYTFQLVRGYQLISAKWDSTCSICGGQVLEGTKVFWQKHKRIICTGNHQQFAKLPPVKQAPPPAPFLLFCPLDYEPTNAYQVGRCLLCGTPYAVGEAVAHRFQYGCLHLECFYDASTEWAEKVCPIKD